MRGGIAGVHGKGLTEAVDGLVAFIGRELPVAFRDFLLTVVLPEEFLGGERGNIAGVQPQGVVQQNTPFLDVASADGLYRGYIILMSPFSVFNVVASKVSQKASMSASSSLAAFASSAKCCTDFGLNSFSKTPFISKTHKSPSSQQTYNLFK